MRIRLEQPEPGTVDVHLRLRGGEGKSADEPLDLLTPGTELVLGEDGVWDVAEPDEPASE